MLSSRRADVIRESGAALVLFLAGFLATSLGARGPSSFVFQLGPNDHRYISGFASHYEVADGVATRWTTYDAAIDLPLTLEGGPFVFSYRYSRVFGETAEVDVYVDERPVDRFWCRGGIVETRETPVPVLSRTPFELRFDIDSHERQNLGLRLDWIGVEAGDNAVIRVRGAPFWLSAALAPLLFGLFRLGGLSRSAAFACASVWVPVVVVGTRVDVFSFAHLLRHLGLATIVLGLIAVALLRRMPAGAWVVPIFVLAFLTRGVGLFHPRSFYPDVANARKYVETFRETSGTLAERGVETQTRTNVGYPRNIAGKDYAFPYSPLYFLPFQAFYEPGDIEDAVRYGGLVAATLTILPIFWIASSVFGPRVGVAASFLWTFLPPIFSRLLLALHATVVGNFLDTLVIASVLFLALRPTSTRRLLLVSAATFLCLLVYTSSLVSVSLFFLSLSIFDRKLAPKLVAVLAGCGAVSVVWLYWPFLSAFFTEILPAVAGGSALKGQGGEAPAPAWLAFARVPLFYGYAYPVLAVLGLVLARREARPEGSRVLFAWSLALLLMLGLRAFGAGLFRDLKEIVFAAPLVAILAGASLEAIERRGGWGRFAALVVVSGLVFFGLWRYAEYLGAG